MSVLSVIVNRLIEARLKDTHVSYPATVESYDRVLQRCSASPDIGRGVTVETGKRVVEFMPIVNDIPIAWSGGITWELAKGDTVMLVIASRCIDRWLVRGGKVDPVFDRHHDKNDAWAVPGVSDFAHALPAVATHESARVLYAPEGDLRLGDSTADDPIIRLSDLIAFMNIAVTVTDSAGAIAALVTALGWTPITGTPRAPGSWPNPTTIVKSK